MATDTKSVVMDVEQDRDEKTVLNQHVDTAAKFLTEVDAYPPLSPEAERKLIRKVDWIMIPIVSSLTFP
jgi:ACS family allantoate permease-like MFS transporter